MTRRHLLSKKQSALHLKGQQHFHPAWKNIFFIRVCLICLYSTSCSPFENARIFYRRSMIFCLSSVSSKHVCFFRFGIHSIISIWPTSKWYLRQYLLFLTTPHRTFWSADKVVVLSLIPRRSILHTAFAPVQLLMRTIWLSLMLNPSVTLAFLFTIFYAAVTDSGFSFSTTCQSSSWINSISRWNN